MSNMIDKVDAASLRDDLPPFRPGDTIKVNVKVVEGTRSRIQVFQGVVISRRGGGTRSMFTVAAPAEARVAGSPHDWITPGMCVVRKPTCTPQIAKPPLTAQ